MKGLIDTTLREGAQTTGISFTLAQKQAIVKALIKTGVEEIELGIATPFDHDLPSLVDFCKKSTNKNLSYSLWSMCRKSDIEYAAGLKPDVLSLSIPVSDLHIVKRLNKSRGWVLRTLRETIAWAKHLGFKKMSLGLEDATTAEASFLAEIMKTAEENGIFRLRFADTVGIASPLSIRNMITAAKADYSMEIGVHTHNDFGMATANCLTALEAGADWADVTVLGIGERAGNARFEEVVGYLALQKGRHYRTENIRELCNLVSQAANQEISARHPVIGHDIFTCETGLHLQGLERDPMTYEPYAPQKVGARRRLIYGAKIGRNYLRKRLTALAIPLPLEHINELTNHVRIKASELGRPLEDAEIMDLCAEKTSSLLVQ